jgi:hypothetical protein
LDQQRRWVRGCSSICTITTLEFQAPAILHPPREVILAASVILVVRYQQCRSAQVNQTPVLPQASTRRSVGFPVQLLVCDVLIKAKTTFQVFH